MDADVKGDIYEGLLARTAAESPRGAGQYFTPRGLIAAIVDCVRPTAKDTVCDPAAGTGGFLLAAHSFASKLAGPKPTRSERDHLSRKFVHGWELVPNTARLCVMNLYLHGVNADPSPLHIGVDSLAEAPSRKFTVVLTNPPFGKKGSLPVGRKTVGIEERESDIFPRTDLWTLTANKQLNFLQHAYSLLEPGGRCAIVVPDNVLSEAGAGEVVRRKLFEKCNVHTLLRLPPGIFYAQGVKANVLFFDRERPARGAGLWVYDLRTDMHFTLRQRPIQRSDLDEFVECYSPQHLGKRRATWSVKRPQGRWRRFDRDILLSRDRINLDLTWLREEEIRSANADLPPSHELAATITDELRTALEHFQRVTAGLNRSMT
jgi:type I restriction enzyme M protein